MLLVILFAAYFAFQTSAVQTFLVRQITNRLSEKLNTKVSIKDVDIRFFNKVVLHDFLMEDQQQDTMLFVGEMVASVDHLSFKKQVVRFSSIEMNRTKLFVSLNENQVPNYNFILDALRSTSDTVQKSPSDWDFYCQTFLFSDTRLGYSYYKMKKPNTIDLHDIHLDVSDFKLHRDSLAFNITDLSLDDHKSFNLNHLSAQVVSSNHIIKLQNLQLQTPHSKIMNADVTLDQTDMAKGKDISFLKLDVNVKNSLLDFTDLGQLVPAVRGMNLKLHLSGHIFGTIADLKGKDVKVEYGENTRLIADFYANGLPDIDRTYILLDLKNSTADFNDLNQIKLPNSSKADYLQFSQLLYDAGVIHYEGNFTGFLSDFVAYGTVKSNFGQVKTDLSFVPSGKNLLKVNGHLKTVNFKLGQFTQYPKFGELTFNGQINGSISRLTRAFDAAVEGVVDSLEFNNYKFKNLTLDGNVQDRKFEGDFSIKDPNLDANFAGKLDFNSPVPKFDFEMTLGKANLRALNLDHLHEKSMLSFILNANFKGNSIDNLDGNIWFEEGHYLNENDTVQLNSLTINTFYDTKAHLQVHSDFADADIAGNYSFSTISQSLSNILYRYLPASGLVYDPKLNTNQFDFDVSLKDLEPLTRTFMPQLYIGPSEITGRFDDMTQNLELTANIPRIEYRNLILNGYTLSIHSADELQFKSRLEELRLNKDQKIYNLALLADASENHLNPKIVWNNFNVKTYSGELETKIDFTKNIYNKPHVEIDVVPSKIYVADTLWRVHPATITVDSTRIQVDNFQITNLNQQLALDGVVSTNQSDRLNLQVAGIDLSNLNLLTNQELDFGGVLNGSASVFDVYEKPLFLSDLKIKGLSYLNHLIGDVGLSSKWDRQQEAIQSKLIIDSKSHRSLVASGKYTPSTDSLDFKVNLNDLSLNVLEPVLEGTFENIRGRGTGNVWLHGTPDKILMDGDVLGLDAGLMIPATQVDYFFTDTVKFRADSIVFDHIKIADYEGNTGIFNGSIRSDNFANMDYSMTISSQKILAINTTYRDNEQFYGKGYAKGLFRIGGHAEKVYLYATAETLPGTSINIALDYQQQAQEYDFLRFINNKENKDANQQHRVVTDNSKLYMNFDFDVTPDAQIQLIYNSQIGDVIRARGNGNLQVEVDPDMNIDMYGEYRVEKGDYLFTLQNVINKKFEIAQGGTIRWNGDPYNANIDLEAIYKLKASLAELVVNPTENNIDYSQRIPVSCEIFLTENLNNPNIAFNIDFPTAEDRIKDQVRQYFSTEEDMNKQILSLLVMGQFYTPEYLRGSYQASNTNLVGTTASELFSNQLSNWLSQISNDFDIGVNYRPGNQLTNDEVELALSTQMFNDRVTLNGNIGNNGTRGTTANSSNIVGDFDLNVKLTNNGKLQLKAYNHSNNNLFYETSPYTQGIGVSYRENYDTFGELWRKFKRLFSKKKKE
ncbi:MAG TPA: translocation/assembly module TamB domain-containing protein [Sunxiuqinia sp.]|nr:translocation/assembly module TamB domain-containing protein [Sunxiuqinia sp.]